MLRVAENRLNKRSRTADTGWSYTLGVGRDANNSSPPKRNMLRMNIKTSAYGCLCLQEMRQHKPWFDEECLGFLHQRKRAKMQ